MNFKVWLETVQNDLTYFENQYNRLFQNQIRKLIELEILKGPAKEEAERMLQGFSFFRPIYANAVKMKAENPIDVAHAVATNMIMKIYTPDKYHSSSMPEKTFYALARNMVRNHLISEFRKKHDVTRGLPENLPAPRKISEKDWDRLKAYTIEELDRALAGAKTHLEAKKAQLALKVGKLQLDNPYERVGIVKLIELLGVEYPNLKKGGYLLGVMHKVREAAIRAAARTGNDELVRQMQLLNKGVK